MKKRLLLWLFNLVLKWFLSKGEVQERQRVLVRLLNQILEATRDFKIDEGELELIQESFKKLIWVVRPSEN